MFWSNIGDSVKWEIPNESFIEQTTTRNWLCSDYEMLKENVIRTNKMVAVPQTDL